VALAGAFSGTAVVVCRSQMATAHWAGAHIVSRTGTDVVPWYYVNCVLRVWRLLAAKRRKIASAGVNWGVRRCRRYRAKDCGNVETSRRLTRAAGWRRYAAGWLGWRAAQRYLATHARQYSMR